MNQFSYLTIKYFRLIRALELASPGLISHELIEKDLNISWKSVRKYVWRLRRDGYDIKSNRFGYRLNLDTD